MDSSIVEKSTLWVAIQSPFDSTNFWTMFKKKQGDGIIFDYDLVKINATSSTVLEFVEDAVGYKIELIEKD